MQTEYSNDTGPLSGVRVLDLTQVLAGPYCSLLLADMGADVIKIERPPDGDPVRALPPLVEGQSTYFMSVNRNKRSVVIDLAQKDGLHVFYNLLGNVDVVLDNFRPGVTERLGIDYTIGFKLRYDDDSFLAFQEGEEIAKIIDSDFGQSFISFGIWV